MSKNYELLSRAAHRGEESLRPSTSRRSSSPFLRWRAGEMPAPEADCESILQILARRRVYLYLSTGIALALAALVCVFMKPQYKAESTVEVLRQDIDRLSIANGKDAPDSSDANDFNLNVQTQLGVLNSDRLAWQVIQKLQLAQPKDIPSNAKEGAPAPSTKEGARILKDFKDHLKVKAVSGTRLIKVSYVHPDPSIAAKIVNRVVSDFLQYEFEVRYNATNKATEWLRAQLVGLKAQVERNQARAVELRRKAGILGQDEGHNIVLTRLEDLNNQVTTAEADRVVKQTIYTIAGSQNPELIAGLLGAQPGRNTSGDASPAALIHNLRQQEASIQAEYSDAASKYGPAYPRLVQLKEKLNSIRSSIAAEVRKAAEQAKSDYEIAGARENAARKALTQQKALAEQMNDRAVDFQIAQQEADSSRTLYDHLSQRLEEAGVLAGLQSNKLQVVDSATVPTRPDRPKVPLYLALGLLSGLMLGVVSIIAVECVDQTVRDAGRLEWNTDAPVLGVVPYAGELSSGKQWLRRPLADSDRLPTSLQLPILAESFRAVRASLLLSRPARESQVLLVSSSIPQEGKSFTSLNLAASLACSGGKVLLVDCDLRRGTLSKALRQESKNGISDVLRGEVSVEAAYQHVRSLSSLVFLPAGNGCRPELLQSKAMTALLRNWRDEFAHVVIDTPPLLPVADALVLAPGVDAVILVARFGVTNLPSITRALRLLRDVQAPSPSLLMNGVNVHSPEYYRYSGSCGYGEYASGTGESYLFVNVDATSSNGSTRKS